MSAADPARWQAVALAGHTGDEPTARAALSSADPEARVLALGALTRLGVLTAVDVAAAVDDPHHGVRRRVALLGATRADVPVAALLDDPEPTVVDAAAWAAGERGEAAVDLVPRLADLAVTAEDALVRESCIAALGAIGDPRGLPAVLAGCRDKPAVRRRAVLALAPFDGPEVEAALAAALEDRDWQVRQAAEDVTPVHTPGHED